MDTLLKKIEQNGHQKSIEKSEGFFDPWWNNGSKNSYEKKRSDDVLVLEANKDIPHAKATKALDELEKKIAREKRHQPDLSVVLDFSAVSQIDKAFFESLPKINEKLNGRLAVANLRENIVGEFDAAGLDSFIARYQGIQSAAADFVDLTPSPGGVTIAELKGRLPTLAERSGS